DNNTNTGLAASDIFFFANRIGDVGTGTATLYQTTAADEIAARNNQGGGSTVTNIFDFDRSGVVSATDQIISPGHVGSLTKINTSSPPGAPQVADGGDAVAAALSLPNLPGLPKLPSWLTSRLSSLDLNSGPIARFFTHLAQINTPTSRAILVAADQIADALGLDDSLLDSLLEDLGLE